MENNMKVIFNVADTREPVRTYQLEHRSGSQIKIVEDGIEDTKYVGLKKLNVSSNQLPQGASSANDSIGKISATVKVIITFLSVIRRYFDFKMQRVQ